MQNLFLKLVYDCFSFFTYFEENQSYLNAPQNFKLSYKIILKSEVIIVTKQRYY